MKSKKQLDRSSEETDLIVKDCEACGEPYETLPDNDSEFCKECSAHLPQF